MPSHQFYHECTVPLQSWRSIVSLEIKDNHPNLWMAKILSNLSRITSCILAWLAINVPLRVLKIYCYFWEHIKITNGHLAGWLDHTFLTSLLKYYLWSHKTYQEWSIKYSDSDEKLLLFEVNQNLRLNIFNHEVILDKFDNILAIQRLGWLSLISKDTILLQDCRGTVHSW
jgi:hypothetical protein